MQRTLYLTPCAVALALAASAAGQVVYSTGFDSTDNPPFSRGSIGGQNGWFVAPSSASGTIQDVITASGGQVLEVVDAASFGRAQKEISTSAIGPIFTSRYSMYVPTAWATIPAEVLDRFEAQQRVEFTDVGGGAHGVEFGFITTGAQYGELQPGQSAVYIEVTSDDVVTGAAFQVIDTASFVDAWHTFDLS